MHKKYDTKTMSLAPSDSGGSIKSRRVQKNLVFLKSPNHWVLGFYWVLGFIGSFGFFI